MKNIYKINYTEKVDKHRNEEKQNKKVENIKVEDIKIETKKDENEKVKNKEIKAKNIRLKKIKNINEIIKKHKIISLIFTTFFILSCLNLCMIYSFIKILDNANFY